MEVVYKGINAQGHDLETRVSALNHVITNFEM